MSLPTEKDVDRALQYLASTDESVSQAIAAVKAQEHLLKTEKALAFLQASGTVAEREALSVTGEEYRAAIQSLEDAVATAETLKAKRKRAELVIDVWRSLNASRRQGG